LETKMVLLQRITIVFIACSCSVYCMTSIKRCDNIAIFKNETKYKICRWSSAVFGTYLCFVPRWSNDIESRSETNKDMP
jgi:hypothetical protein